MPEAHDERRSRTVSLHGVDVNRVRYRVVRYRVFARKRTSILTRWGASITLVEFRLISSSNLHNDLSFLGTLAMPRARQGADRPSIMLNASALKR